MFGLRTNGQRKMNKLAFAILAVTMSVSTVSADIISGNYDVDVGGLSPVVNVPFSGVIAAGVNSLGPVTQSGGSSVGAALAFEFSGSQLTLGVDWSGTGFNGFGSPVEWDFTGLGLTGGASITGISFNAAASTLGVDAPTGFSFTANSLDDIDTPNETSNGVNATYSYVFDITDSAAAAVPEPSSFAILFAGGVGFLARRRRQKKAVA
jgi:hypothetical protein